MRLVRRLLLRERPLTRIRHRQRARDDEQLGDAAAVPRRENHAANPGVDRQARKLASERRQAALGVDGAQLSQQLEAVGDRARTRRLDERKRLDVAQRERGHPQDHRGERAAQDLGIRVLRADREIVFAVKAHADAVGDTPAATRALVRRRLRDLLDLQQRRLVAQRIPLDARDTGVDHVPDPRYRERSLGDVGGEDDASPPGRREHALLFRHREACVQREDFDGRRIRSPREPLVQQIGGLAYLALAR